MVKLAVALGTDCRRSKAEPLAPGRKRRSGVRTGLETEVTGRELVLNTYEDSFSKTD